jgi:hypothetical protein
MNNQITVRDVIEYNDCAGKKYISVTSMEEDEIVPSRFLLSRKWMPADHKLGLSAVAPLDVVTVNYHHINGLFNDPSLVGEYVENLTDVYTRDPLCRCGHRLVCDGFDLYCPNTLCALTLATKINRLGNTVFFDSEVLSHDPSTGEARISLAIGGDPSYSQPFFMITQGMFWGTNVGTLEHTLLTRNFGSLSLATFLIQPLFKEFLEMLSPQDVLDNIAYLNVDRFYDSMDLIINERNINSPQQQLFMKSFLWCLGIEALLEEHVDKMMVYEASYGAELDPLLTYAYVLCNPGVMISDLNIHPLEASAIANEVKRRSHELHDIFYHYTNENHDIVELFSHYM